MFTRDAEGGAIDCIARFHQACNEPAVPQTADSATTPPTLAVVIPCYNEEAALPATLAALSDVLSGMIGDGLVSDRSYLYFVDDGSSDATWSILAEAGRNSPRVRGLKLSRNFGHQSALLAGLETVAARCDISISIDADLQQDPLAMRRFVEKHRDGADVVLGVRRDRASDGAFKKSTALGFYRLMKLMGVTIVPNHADYRLLSRRAMAALGQHTEPNIFLRAICAQLGFRTAIVDFDVVERKAGVSKYSLAKMLRFALHGITAFSVVPLRLIGIVGLLIFAVSVVMGAYVLIRAASGDTVPGWASITLPIYFLGGTQILCLAVMGEYIAQILTGVKKRPRYIVEDELP
jgi:glycosyltransferase involved in cell wall biosynthesis